MTDYNQMSGIAEPSNSWSIRFFLLCYTTNTTWQPQCFLWYRPADGYQHAYSLMNSLSLCHIASTSEKHVSDVINPLKPELNPICYLLALLEAHHFLHVSRIRVKLLTLR